MTNIEQKNWKNRTHSVFGRMQKGLSAKLYFLPQKEEYKSKKLKDNKKNYNFHSNIFYIISKFSRESNV